MEKINNKVNNTADAEIVSELLESIGKLKTIKDKLDILEQSKEKIDKLDQNSKVRLVIGFLNDCLLTQKDLDSYQENFMYNIAEKYIGTKEKGKILNLDRVDQNNKVKLFSFLVLENETLRNIDEAIEFLVNGTNIDIDYLINEPNNVSNDEKIALLKQCLKDVSSDIKGYAVAHLMIKNEILQTVKAAKEILGEKENGNINLDGIGQDSKVVLFICLIRREPNLQSVNKTIEFLANETEIEINDLDKFTNDQKIDLLTKCLEGVSSNLKLCLLNWMINVDGTLKTFDTVKKILGEKENGNINLDGINQNDKADFLIRLMRVSENLQTVDTAKEFLGTNNNGRLNLYGVSMENRSSLEEFLPSYLLNENYYRQLVTSNRTNNLNNYPYKNKGRTK